MLKSIILSFLLIFSTSTFSCSEKKVSFKIEGLKKGDTWSKLGMKNGDILKEVNGQEVCDAETFSTLIWDAFGKKDNIEIKLNRAGKMVSLRFGKGRLKKRN